MAKIVTVDAAAAAIAISIEAAATDDEYCSGHRFVSFPFLSLLFFFFG